MVWVSYGVPVTYSLDTRIISYLCLLFLAAGGQLHAQDSIDAGNNAKLVYQYQKRVKEKLRHFGDWKYEELLESGEIFGPSETLSTFSGVSYDLNQRIRIEGALGLYYTWQQSLDDIFEARLWQAATFDWPDVTGGFRRYVVHHRFMLEERFKDSNDWDMKLRGRYRLSFSYPINRYTLEPGVFYLPLAAEFYTNSGNEGELFGASAKFTAGVGYVLDKIWSLELRYTREESRDTVDGDFQVSNNIFEFRAKTSFLIRDLLKSR